MLVKEIEIHFFTFNPPKYSTKNLYYFDIKQNIYCPVPIISALERQREVDEEFKVILSHIENPMPVELYETLSTNKKPKARNNKAQKTGTLP